MIVFPNTLLFISMGGGGNLQKKLFDISNWKNFQDANAVSISMPMGLLFKRERNSGEQYTLLPKPQIWHHKKKSAITVPVYCTWYM